MPSLRSPLGSRQQSYPTATLLRILQNGIVSTNLEITTFPLQTLSSMRLGTQGRICKFGQRSTTSAKLFLQKVRLDPHAQENDQGWGAGSRIRTEEWTMPAMPSRSGEGESIQIKGSANRGPSPIAIRKEQTTQEVIGGYGDRSPCPSTTKVQPGPVKRWELALVALAASCLVLTWVTWVEIGDDGTDFYHQVEGEQLLHFILQQRHREKPNIYPKLRDAVIAAVVHFSFGQFPPLPSQQPIFGKQP